MGGEEFLVIFPSQTVEEAAVSMERCRVAVESQVFAIEDALEPIKLAVSGGLASYGTRRGDVGQLLKDADGAFYLANGGGLNGIYTAAGLAGGAKLEGRQTIGLGRGWRRWGRWSGHGNQ